MILQHGPGWRRIFSPLLEDLGQLARVHECILFMLFPTVSYKLIVSPVHRVEEYRKIQVNVDIVEGCSDPIGDVFRTSRVGPASFCLFLQVATRFCTAVVDFRVIHGGCLTGQGNDPIKFVSKIKIMFGNLSYSQSG